MADLAALIVMNAKRWAQAKILPSRAAEFKAPAQKAVDNRARYEAIQTRTGVSWLFIAVSHYRESTQNFSRSLAQGDPWNKVSTHVPAGRGPFASFEDAAVDALVNCAPFAARNNDWSIASMLSLLERCPTRYRGWVCQRMNHSMLQWLTNCVTPWQIDRVVQNMEIDSKSGPQLATYARYNVLLEPGWMKTEVGMDQTAANLAKIAEMDDPANMDDLAEIGRIAAAKQVKPEHFPANFDFK